MGGKSGRNLYLLPIVHVFHEGGKATSPAQLPNLILTASNQGTSKGRHEDVIN